MTNETKKIKITGERGMTVKEIIVDVRTETEDVYIVRHTDGKMAFVGLEGGEYARMDGVKYIRLMRNCTVEVIE